MDLGQSISRMHAAGVTLRVHGDRLTVKSEAPLTDAQRAWIRANKTALLQMAADIPTAPPPAELTEGERVAVQEAIEERAAIREFEAGESRAEAERAARRDMRVYRVRVVMPEGGERWATLLAPGCGPQEAVEAAVRTFGRDRVIEVISQDHGDAP